MSTIAINRGVDRLRDGLIQLLLIVNRGAYPMTVAHEDTTVSARLRIQTPDVLAHAVPAGYSALLAYDYLTGRWVLANVGEYGMPSGAIIMWSGAVSAVPAGWALCDGTNGTPDLRDRMVVAAGGAYAVGANGGAATHTHAGHSNHVREVAGLQLTYLSFPVEQLGAIDQVGL